ncbi:hypothetical protein L1987_76433 [Smallanthus sonchifolius]|uniref:Uncharacterized protein n=1 Tax=Smallanthus sonchifolius TaxID=185202 RepID=A0ACB8ZBL5_9ASTR|nr:hypothetical protein L1987_76433 [Smallanthus sonchifolius]
MHLNTQHNAEEGETEVNSEKRDKTRTRMDPEMNGEGNSLVENLVNTEYTSQVTGKDVWVEFCMYPKGVKWPEDWCQSNAHDREDVEWNQVLDRAKEAWNGIIPIENHEGYQRLRHALSLQAGDPTPLFFGKYNQIVECLAKWLGRHKLTDHEAWRNIKAPAGRPSRWLDIERETCQPEEAHHRKKKKRKSKGKNPFSNDTGNEFLDNGVSPTKGEDNRTRHKIWFSRNRRPEKNLSLKKITFSQEAIPNTAPINLMGLGNFHAGSDKSKHSQVGAGRKESHMSKLDALFEDLVARKEKLRSIVANINTSDEDKMMVNSILSMKKFKVLKFSAKMNDEGNVIIDENMVELDNGPVTIPVTQAEPPQASYACKLTGKGGTLRDEKIQYYPPMADRGPGIRQRQSYKPTSTRQAWAMNQDTSRDKGINGGFMYSRNIVNKQARQEIPESSRSNGERINLENPPQQPVQNEPPLSSVNPKSRRQVDNRRKVDREDDQSIRMVETKNRFLLLNKDGDDIDGDRITQDMDQQANTDLEKGNDGWRKRQERTLNVRFRNLVTQKQRFEAKRLILDRLVPLESTLSEWTPPAFEYFRHMCSIFDFGEGLQAVARDRLTDQDNLNMELDHSDEEVASEIDGTADLMKTDAPVVNHSDLDDGSVLGKLTNQPLTDGISPVGKNSSQL